MRQKLRPKYILNVGIARFENFLGPLRMGSIDYICSLGRAERWGGAFNGQEARRALFRTLLDKCSPAAIVETGTYRGATTKFMAEHTAVPIHTVESDPRTYGFARLRLARYVNVKLHLGDSRPFLRDFAKANRERYSTSPLLFYLDAHWDDDLPLADELEQIVSMFPLAVVMIDDFQVPGDQGYTYDDFGEGKALTRNYICRSISSHNLLEFYPSTSSSAETGARRGCVVITKDVALGSRLANIPLLRKYSE